MACTILLWIVFLAGLVLSILSGLKICTLLCSETAKYSIFGLDFGWFGSVLFALLILLLTLRRRIMAAGPLLFYITSAAVGAELRLIWIQKYIIGSWCPVCLGVAAVLAMAFLVLFYEVLNTRSEFGGTMKTGLIHFAVMVVALLAGFAAALVGVQKEAEAAGPDIYLGKRQSDTTVYFVSDWFCPVCRNVEPEIEKIYPDIASSVRVAFIDMPIHRETTNFTPYNLQFMIYDKEKYLRLRKVLDELSRISKNPTPEEVQSALTPLGVTLRPHNFVELMDGTKLFESVYRGFDVKATPTVVIENSKTRKRKLLIGSRDITKNAIKAAINEVGR
jgi:hypothetical protein